MSRIRRNEARHTGGHNIRINDRLINIYLARIVYRCQACYGELKINNAGLICKSNSEHRGFIHRDDVKIIQEKQSQNIDELEQFYVIKEGNVTIK